MFVLRSVRIVTMCTLLSEILLLDKILCFLRFYLFLKREEEREKERERNINVWFLLA